MQLKKKKKGTWKVALFRDYFSACICKSKYKHTLKATLSRQDLSIPQFPHQKCTVQWPENTQSRPAVTRVRCRRRPQSSGPIGSPIPPACPSVQPVIHFRSLGLFFLSLSCRRNQATYGPAISALAQCFPGRPRCRRDSASLLPTAGRNPPPCGYATICQYIPSTISAFWLL